MTKFEQVEFQLSYLLSMHEERKDDPTYKVQLSLLATQHRLMSSCQDAEPRHEELID